MSPPFGLAASPHPPSINDEIAVDAESTSVSMSIGGSPTACVGRGRARRMRTQDKREKYRTRPNSETQPAAQPDRDCSSLADAALNHTRNHRAQLAIATALAHPWFASLRACDRYWTTSPKRPGALTASTYANSLYSTKPAAACSCGARHAERRLFTRPARMRNLLARRSQSIHLLTR